MKKVSLPGWLFVVILQYLFLLLVFFVFRQVLRSEMAAHQSSVPADLLSEAITGGWPFDIMTVSYLVILPVLAGFSSLFLKIQRMLRWFFLLYFSLAGTIVWLACSADIPYYLFSGSRLNRSLLMWTDTPGAMTAFVFSSPVYYSYLGLFLAGALAWILQVRWLVYKFMRREVESFGVRKKSLVIVITILLLLIGIRGGLRHRPIAIRDAFISNYPAVNLLPLNPLHSFFDSMTDVNLDLLEEEEALRRAAGFLNAEKDFSSPIARLQPGSDTLAKPNIVLILMESFTAALTGWENDGHSSTPFLDSLAQHSVRFTDLYTSGVHTSNGIYGVLYSMPSVPGEHPLSNLHVVNSELYGMPQVLKEKGYSTSFFCTHHEEFDNMGFLLRKNGFDKFYSRKDYPDQPDEGPFGVSDESLYDLAFRKLKEEAASGQPFFASLLTISTHEPPVLPKRTSFRSSSTKPLEQVFEYADWTLEGFIKKCSNEPWYNNTVFVIVADHGYNLESPYEMSLSYHHSPGVFFAPGLFRPETISKLAIQPDLFPTLMGKLGYSYVNHAMGMDLTKEERPFIFFCKDYLVGCMDREKFLIVRKFGGESMHAYRKGDPENILESNRELADSMKVYTYSMLQSARWLLENKKLGKPTPIAR